MKPTHSHGFNPSETAPDYEACDSCGSLHRIHNLAPETVYTSNYWNRPNHSTIHEQVHNVAVHIGDNGLTKCQTILQHAGSGERALEIGCAPGSLLLQLREHFKQVVGIECDPAYRADILAISEGAASLVFGQFPELSRTWQPDSIDLICALDVFEHIEDGESFMAEVVRLLKPTGTVILMGPFLFGDGVFRESDFHPEHIWLYSQQFLRDWFGEMFEFVDFDRWQPGHEVLIARTKKTPPVPGSDDPPAGTVKPKKAKKTATKPQEEESKPPEEENAPAAAEAAPEATETTTETPTPTED